MGSTVVKKSTVRITLVDNSGVPSERPWVSCDMTTSGSCHREPFERLNERHREVLVLVCKGLRNSEIGKLLGVTERTVKWYMTQLFLILGATNRTELVGLFASLPSLAGHEGEPNTVATGKSAFSA